MRIKTILLAAVTLSSMCFADNCAKPAPCTPPCLPPTCQVCSPGDQCLPAQCCPSFNLPARIELTCNWDLAVSGSFIYWLPFQEQMEIGASTTPFDAFTPGAVVAFQNFQFKPGFKAGIEFSSNYDSWNFGAEYTWFFGKFSDSFSAPAGFNAWSIDDWFIGGNTFTNSGQSLSSKWKLHFNLWDVYVTRPFYEGRCLTILPFTGIRAITINQKLSTSSSLAFLKSKSKEWMLGPDAGVQANWLLGGGFRFEGIADASLMYSRFTTVSITNNFDTSTTFPGSSTLTNFGLVSPVFKMAMGFGWGSYFSCNNYHFDLSATYDFMYIFNQNMLRYYARASFDAAGPIGALSFQGLTATARFDF